MNEFRWNQWNLEHATKDGVTAREAERVVDNRGAGGRDALRRKS